LPGPALQPIIERRCARAELLARRLSANVAQWPIPAFVEIYIVGTLSGRAQNRLQLVLYAHPKLTGDAEILFAAAGEEVGHAHRL
jgi:hypothetical protein